MDEKKLLKNNIITDSVHRQLLKKRPVIDEINRHLWIESEKAGYDIGFEKAALDWLKRFSKTWTDYHMPKRKNQNLRPSPKRRKNRRK